MFRSLLKNGQNNSAKVDSFLQLIRLFCCSLRQSREKKSDAGTIMSTEKVHRQQSTPSGRKKKLDFVLVTGGHKFFEQLETVGVEPLDKRLLVPRRSALELVGVREHKLENAPLHRQLSIHINELKAHFDRLNARIFV